MSPLSSIRRGKAGGFGNATDSPYFWVMACLGKMMTKTNVNFLVVLVALALAGCSAGAGLLDPKATVPSASNVPVGNNLAMPPDLQLAAPSGTSDAYQPNGGAAPVIAAPVTKQASKPASKVASNGNLYGNTAAAAPAATGDVFEQYGISKTKPDGTPKTPEELRQELQAILLKKKQQQNPKYGTISNIGSIFSDQ